MSDNALWQFSCTLYPSLQDTLLELQDEQGLDVNLLLCACWLARQGSCWNLQQLAALSNISHRFREDFINDARRLRRALTTDVPQAVYEAAKGFELALERWQQDEMFSCCRDVGLLAVGPKRLGFIEAAQRNIEQYFGQLGLAWNEMPARLIRQAAQALADRPT